MKSLLYIISIRASLLLLFSNILSGQYYNGNEEQGGNPYQHNQVEKMIPKTPESTSFEKFVNIPQGNYSGIHGFSVPIYSIPLYEGSFPISIDYHGMGINVHEISGSVGIGWNLNIGGISFSQEVRGFDDFTSIKLTPLNYWQEYGNGNIIDSENEEYENVLKLTGGYDAIIGHFPRRSFELNPDYFSYSLLNNSGKFILDGNKDFITIPKDVVEFTSTFDPDDREFEITDKKGIQYTFNGYVNSTSQTGTNPQIENYSYSLSSIFFPETNKSMSFTYESSQYKYISNYEKQVMINMGGSLESCGYNGERSAEEQSVSMTNVLEERLIKTITYDEIYIEFKYIGNRDDLGGAKGKRLSKIEVYHKPPGATMKKIKDYVLTTSFLGEGTYFSGTAFTDYNTIKARMWLDSIGETLSGGMYNFEYDGRNNLPKRFSPKTDWWGSYNGEGNTTYIPSYKYKLSDGTQKYHWGANKEPNATEAIKGALKRVYLPTGGYQEYEYELDEYRFQDEERVYSSQSYVLPTINDNGIDWTPPTYIPIPVGNPDYRLGFDYVLTFQTLHVNCDPNGDQPGVPTGTYYRYELYEEGGGFIDSFIVENSEQYKVPEFDPAKNYYFKVIKIVNPILPGDNCEEPDYPIIITPQINWIHEEDIYKENKNAGHLRVSSISLYDSNGVKKISKHYAYKDFSDSDKSLSSGHFTGLPLHYRPSIYQSGQASQNPGPCEIPPLCKKTIISNNPSLNLNSSYGKSVFYENVTEFVEDLKNPGESYAFEFVFKMPSEEGFPASNEAPITYRPHNEYTGGQILEQRLYNDSYNPMSTNNNANLVKRILNDYSSPDYHFNQESSYHVNGYDEFVGYGLAATLIARYSVISGNCHYYYEHRPNNYQITSAWIKHLSTTAEEYQNGLLKMTNTTNYEYDNTYSHLNPVRVTTSNSLGQQVKTEYTYDHPYKKDEPTTILQYENGNPVSVQKTTFNSEGLPEYIFAKKGSSTLDSSPPSDDLKITYEQYDTNGNLQQYRLADGTPVSIIWGYNGQYPIAKVEGVAYTTIASEAEDLADLSDVGTLTESSFENLRNTSGALVTCYIYEPLVGVKMIIQSNGLKETYEYDNAGRLIKVKDHEGNELKKTDYHYYNQP